MSQALDRWTKKDTNGLNEILGEGENVQPVGETRPSEVSLRIIGVEHDFDDVSTIADDTITGGVAPHVEDPRTPKKRKIPYGNGDDDTQPETPPKHENLDQKGYDSYELNKGWSPRFFRLVVAASILGSILLGSIAVMSATLYQLRRESKSTASASVGSASPLKPIQGEGEALFDFDPSPTQSPTKASTPMPTQMAIKAPVQPQTQAPAQQQTQTPVQPQTSKPTELPRAPTDSPTFGTMEPTSQPTAPLPPTEIPIAILDLAETLLSVDPVAAFYESSSSVLTQPTSVQYGVLEWMSADPLLDTYSTDKLVQRYALSVFYSGLSFEEGAFTTDTWMTYTDECDWPLSRDSREICESNGNVTSIYLEDLGFSGTIAPELGLLSGLARFFVAANNLRGQLPSEIGMLQEIERFNVARNRIDGAIPTEFGLLQNLDLLLMGRNLLSGSLPTQLGELDKLKSLEIQRNYFVGTIPEDIGRLSALTSLRLEINGLSGALPDGLADLANLETFRLENNNLNGAVPGGFCAKNENLEDARVDCDEVICQCCEGCLENDEVVEPPSQEDCAYVITSKDCYAQAASIPLETSTCAVEDSHIIAMYEAEALARFGFRNPLFWLSLCDDEVCNSTIADGFLIREDGSADRFDFTPTPLEGEYVVLILNVIRPGAIELVAQGEPFQVGNCRK